MSEKVPRLDDRSSNLDFRIPERRRLAVGEVIEGMVVSIGQSTVFVDVGAKSEASLDLSEVMDEKGEAQVKVGDKVSAYIVALEPEVTLSYALARKQLNLQAIEDAREMGIPVEGRVTGVNKGGLEVDLGGARGFCPISQIDLGYCEDASVHVGKAYDFRVIEFSEGGRKLVVSRRALLEEERREAQEALQSQLQEGAQFEGEVKSLHPYGAFVDIGGMEGMVHISEIAHGHIEHPQEVLRVGQTVKVKVLKIERDPKHPDRQRIGLSIRALLGDPWQAAGMLQEGDQVDGKVVRLQPFGAFVEISPGVDGLIHISELCDRRVSHPSDVVSLGQAVKATVIKVDTAQKRISLSLRGGGGTEVAEALSVGSMVDCVVDKIKPFGLLVRIKGAMRNARGLIPAEETATGRNANLRRSFPEGTELKAMVIQVDPETGKLRLSLRAQAEHEEREELGKLMGSGAPAVTPPASLGTFGDLFKKASAPKGGRGK